MRLKDLGPQPNLEDVVVWGIWPMKELVQILNEHIQEDDDDDKRELFIMYELRNKLEDLEETLYRIVDNRRHLRVVNR